MIHCSECKYKELVALNGSSKGHYCKHDAAGNKIVCRCKKKSNEWTVKIVSSKVKAR